MQRRDGRQVARVDFLFRQHGIVVEVTGRLGHSTPTERGRDAQRRNERLDLGLLVYEYTWAHVTQREPWVVATLRQRLRAREPAPEAERHIRMGSTTRHITAIAALVVLGACSAGDDDDDAADAPAERVAASADALAAPEAAAGGEGATADIAATMQIPGQAIAIEARASMQADDVGTAVDAVIAAATTRGGRVAAADIDYVTDESDGERSGSRATLVLEVPPDQIGAIVDTLEQLGTVVSFDQLAEDVTDQLADLDTRIANLRASIERVRALYSDAVDIDSIVRLEAELTQRETSLEQLLATQQALEDRVAMSTFTVEIAAAPETLEADDPGVADALGAGWSAFIGVVFAVVLGLAAAAPFVATAAVLTLGVLWVRQRLVTASRQG